MFILHKLDFKITLLGKKEKRKERYGILGIKIYIPNNSDCLFMTVEHGAGMFPSNGHQNPVDKVGLLQGNTNHPSSKALQHASCPRGGIWKDTGNSTSGG